MAVEWVAVWPREQRACAASRCLFFALLLLLDLPYAVAQPSGGDRVVKVVSFEFGITLLDAFSRNIMAGFNASLHSRNNSIMNGVRVEIVEKKTKFTNYASDLSAALKADNDIFAVVGHCGDKLLLNIKDVLAEHDVVAFSPFTGSSLVRGWNPNFTFCVLNLRPSCWHSSATPWPICVCVGWASCTCREFPLVTGSMRRHNA
ncbi:putative receptor-type adenylate cyclase [Trypanosoma cruzi]|uniref:Putative receptor-type adenylate cyclase n=1 Tax=Trypanosoma cruzi TaxID=5693 RepID=A0A2V2VAE8_TRYCR|nr:putative receptor-type adenylate cyclase [Trypanosoma cruzi]